MILTIDHSASINGRPVFIEKGGVVVPDKEALKRIRKMIGEDEMAIVMGVSPSTIANWCEGHRGASKPSLLLLQAYVVKMGL